MLQGFVALPADVQLAITSLVGVVVAIAIQWIIKQFPFLSFLAAYAQEWGLLLGAVVVDALQNALPTGFEDVSIKAILFVLALIGMFVKFLKNRGVQGFV